MHMQSHTHTYTYIFPSYNENEVRKKNEQNFHDYQVLKTTPLKHQTENSNFVNH